MKLLLDENLPVQLRLELPGHDCLTVAYLGWTGKENGELLALAAAHGFDVMLSKDANVEYEQNLSTLPVSVALLRARSNDIDDIRPLIPALLTALDTMGTQRLIVVE